jgi:plasmid stabilization system protein ParE
MKVRLAPQARADLDEIWFHIAVETGAEDAATRIIDLIASKFALFCRFPYIGRAISSERHPDVRTFIAQQYVIFYRPVASEIRILRVIHASRDAFSLFEPNP